MSQQYHARQHLQLNANDVVQGRRERRKKFLDHDVDLMDIDGAMGVLLDVSEPEFKNNVELHGAIHTDELR